MSQEVMRSLQLPLHRCRRCLLAKKSTCSQIYYAYWTINSPLCSIVVRDIRRDPMKHRTTSRSCWGMYVLRVLTMENGARESDYLTTCMADRNTYSTEGACVSCFLFLVESHLSLGKKKRRGELDSMRNLELAAYMTCRLMR